MKDVRYYQKLCKSKRPQNALYETLLQHYEDILMLIKFQFFKDVANILNPFLNMYQTDQPMMIFLCEDLEDMYRRLLKMVVHKAIIDKARTHCTSNQD